MLSLSQNTWFMHAGGVSRKHTCRFVKRGHKLIARHSITPKSPFDRAPARSALFGSIRAAVSSSGAEEVEALQEAASELVQTPEKYYAALETANKVDRAIDAEWEALTDVEPKTNEIPSVLGFRVGETVVTEVPSVRDFCSRTVSDFKSESTLVRITYFLPFPSLFSPTFPCLTFNGPDR